MRELRVKSFIVIPEARKAFKPGIFCYRARGSARVIQSADADFDKTKWPNPDQFDSNDAFLLGARSQHDHPQMYCCSTCYCNLKLIKPASLDSLGASRFFEPAKFKPAKFEPAKAFLLVRKRRSNGTVKPLEYDETIDMLSVRNPHSLIAIIVSTGGLLILLNGAMGTAGNPVLTAALTFLPTIALFALGKFNFKLDVVDVLFLTFVGCVGLSILANGCPPAQEALFLVSTLFAYPACRFIRLGEPRWPFIVVTGAVVATGATATAIVLVSQWDRPDHPGVFGFTHAATVFLLYTGFLLIFCASTRADWKVVLWLACPVAIFAAAMVRFEFVAIVAGMMVAAIRSSDRKRVLRMVAVVCISAAIGLAVHYKATGFQLQNVAQTATQTTAQTTPVCEGNNNSLTIRRTLWRDAIAAVPTAGTLGHGLAWFQRMSCVRVPPHNSFLQAIVEFGWFGGIAFILLPAAGIWRLWPLAIENDEARLVLCCLIYLAAISLVYGNLSHEILLFLFLGYAGRINEQSSGVTVFKWIGLSRPRSAPQTHPV